MCLMEVWTLGHPVAIFTAACRGQGAGRHSPSTHVPSPPKETRRYIGKYSLYCSSETTNQKYNFAFKNLLSLAEDTTIDNAPPSPLFPLENA